MADLADIKDELIQVRTRYTSGVSVASKFVKGVFVTLGAAIAGIAQFATWPAGTDPTGAQVTGIAACIVVFFGGIFVLLTEQDASEAVKVADKAVEAARDAEERLGVVDAIENEMERLAETYQLCLTMRGALEQSVVGTVGTVEDTIASLFDIIARPLSIACGFAQADRWTIGVYKAVPSEEQGKAILRCIAHDRAIKCELNEARSWPEGVGIAGIAYTNGREIVVPDLRDEGVKAVFGPRGLVRPYDADRYVSMVAVPIMVAGREKPWGVVNATSNRSGHFATSKAPGFKYDEPVRALAAFAALAVAMWDAQNRAGRATRAIVPRSVSTGSTGS